jgi:hypothetical protein
LFGSTSVTLIWRIHVGAILEVEQKILSSSTAQKEKKRAHISLFFIVVPSILTTTHPACPGPPKISCSEKKINVALDQIVIQKEAIANPLGELIVKLKIKRKNLSL